MLNTPVLSLGDAVLGFSYAAKNQQVFDRVYYHCLGFEADDFNVLPRPAKWARQNDKLSKILKITSSLVAYSWAYVFAYLFILARIFVHAAKKKHGNSFSGETNQVVVYAVCDRSCMVLSKIKTSTSPQVWIKPPGLKFSTDPERTLGLTVIDATSLLSRSEMVSAGLWALAAHRFIVNNQSVRLGLQSYAVVEWMLMLFATAKVSPKKILTSEHHDRWAVMADFYSSLSTKSGDDCRMELAQHGREYENTYQIIEKVAEERELPYRLENVYKIHVYNQEQLRIFEKHILKRGLAKEINLIVECLDQSIALTECVGDEFKVLIVGHPFCEEFQLEIYNRLFRGSSIRCFYKPHPTAGASKKIRTAGWQFIADTDFFPRVDLLVSYPSTLVDEYREAGIPAAIHHNGGIDGSLDVIVEEIKEHMNLLGVF